MTHDERVIRDLIATWMKASETGDVDTVLSLMAGDVIFMVPGREPFGKDAFRAMSETMKSVRLTGTSDIRELRVLGDWAYIRNYIEITILPPDGAAMRRTGYAITQVTLAFSASLGAGVDNRTTGLTRGNMR